ncbi:MAG: hypothetical protein JJ896_07460 [Rhodothermales bacterium]|nr:hypothetical protein [Rhodothermales bacterium]MBO6779475.1 hypothetical protein [Rhodothermales bacterium]
MGLVPGQFPQELDEEIARLVAQRSGELGAEEDAVRRASRDMLRHGRYKPTGRGKPASEYLMRAAREGSFPRISAPVDICNLISLHYLVPASVWDLDLSGTAFLGRRGREGESYVFNAGGQEIGLQDLLVVCRADSDQPMVNPVKDSHATKTTVDSTRVGAVVYMPRAANLDTEYVLSRFVALLAGCGDAVEAGYLLVEGRP